MKTSDTMKLEVAQDKVKLLELTWAPNFIPDLDLAEGIARDLLDRLPNTQITVTYTSTITNGN